MKDCWLPWTHLGSCWCEVAGELDAINIKNQYHVWPAFHDVPASRVQVCLGDRGVWLQYVSNSTSRHYLRYTLDETSDLLSRLRRSTNILVYLAPGA